MIKVGGSMKKKLPFCKYLVFAVIIVTIITLGLVALFKMLPWDYFGVLLAVLVLINVVLLFLLLSKNFYRNIMGGLLSLIYLVIVIMFIINKLN